jgi:hypothetical protein
METKRVLTPERRRDDDDKMLIQMVARGGIEPPTRGFSVRGYGFEH